MVLAQAGQFARVLGLQAPVLGQVLGRGFNVIAYVVGYEFEHDQRGFARRDTEAAADPSDLAAMRLEFGAQRAKAKTGPCGAGVGMMRRVRVNRNTDALRFAPVRQGQRQFGRRFRNAPGHAQHAVAYRVRVHCDIGSARGRDMFDERFLEQQGLGRGAGRCAVKLYQLAARALGQRSQPRCVRRRSRVHSEQLLVLFQHRKARAAIVGQAIAEQKVLVHAGLRLPVVERACAVVHGLFQRLAQSAPMAAFNLENLLGFGTVAQSRQAHLDIAQRFEISVQLRQFSILRAVGARAGAVPQQADHAWRHAWRTHRFDRHLGHEPCSAA